MLKKIIILFKIGRKVAKSDILNIVSKFKEPPLFLKFLFKILSFFNEKISLGMVFGTLIIIFSGIKLIRIKPYKLN